MHIRRLSLALALFLSLVACSGEAPQPATPEEAVRATVLRWLEAAKSGDKDAALACGTEEFKKKEQSWDRSFTHAIWEKGFKLQGFEPREPSLEGNKATMSVRATFMTPEGEDGEGLRFSLELIDGTWKIVSLT
jgi:hypothetical protein